MIKNKQSKNNQSIKRLWRIPKMFICHDTNIDSQEHYDMFKEKG